MIIELISTKESYTVDRNLEQCYYVDSLFSKRVHLIFLNGRGSISVSSDEEGRAIISKLSEAMSSNSYSVLIDTKNEKSIQRMKNHK